LTNAGTTRIELINTGAELLVGRVLNTHQQWLCRRLADLGYEVSRQVCVPDGSAAIQAAVRESLARADVVIVTGGLGPTSDDLSREVIAQMLGRRLVVHEATLAWIGQFFSARRRPMPARVEVQAMAPEVVPSRQWLILLPGPPRELRPMFLDSVVPLLRKNVPLSSKFLCRNFKTTGQGESVVEEKIAGPFQSLIERGLELAYCARVGEVDVRLTARGEAAADLLDEGEGLIRQLLGPLIFGTGEDSLESVVIQILIERKMTLALAESCTGGFLAHRLTNVPGASAVFLGGAVTYSKQAKEEILGVPTETLRLHGAVSKQVALAMAQGVRGLLKSDFALAITGIAGPGGGSPQKPVGTAFIALASEQGTTVQLQYSPVDRETFKFAVSQRALDMLRQALLPETSPAAEAR
jgi:nicotinamide-nucleotide amidase